MFLFELDLPGIYNGPWERLGVDLSQRITVAMINCDHQSCFEAVQSAR